MCPIINHERVKFVAIIVAAGSGTRMGDGAPKQFRNFLGEAVFLHSLRALASHNLCSACILVHPPGERALVEELISKAKDLPETPIVLTDGGNSRTESVRLGLDAATPYTADYVFIHDAARPGISHQVVSDLIDALSNHQGAAPAIPIVDALKHWKSNRIETRSREHLYRIQTPQAFHRTSISSVILNETASAADEFELAEKHGLSLTLTRGSESLGKLTYPEDFERLETMLSDTEYRTGHGYDVHAFEEGDQLTLCGTQIAHTHGLKGHSDADVAWHALTDAILGALASGDIGDHFPPSDPQWKGVASSVFLEHAHSLVRARSGRIINIDLTIICEAPKIKPHREAMRIATAELLGLQPDRISVKATTTEKLGFEGRKEGIAAHAVVSLALPSRQT